MKYFIISRKNSQVILQISIDIKKGYKSEVTLNYIKNNFRIENEF